jgi:UDP-N-acetylglucosamine 2-epimerase (non-hydrolysing)
MMKQRIREKSVDNHFDSFANKLLILVTVHRRENFGEPLINICEALARIATSYQNKVQIVYPVHLNPNVRDTVFKMLDGYSNISLIDPVGYEDLVSLMSRAYMVMTDSGGIQEEAPSLNKPVLILRNLTERPEVIEAGAAKLIGTDSDRIFVEAQKLIDDVQIYTQMANAPNPFGDGRAGERIVQFLLGHQMS